VQCFAPSVSISVSTESALRLGAPESPKMTLTTKQKATKRPIHKMTSQPLVGAGMRGGLELYKESVPCRTHSYSGYYDAGGLQRAHPKDRYGESAPLGLARNSTGMNSYG
jgi:hypothetical protein